MADIFANNTTFVRTVRPEPLNVLLVQPGYTVTNVGARTVQYDENDEFTSPTNRTTGQSVTTTVATFFRVTAGQGTVAIRIAESHDPTDLDARIDATEADITALTAATTAYTQTYATADRTHAAPTAVAGSSSAGANGYSSAGEAAAIQTAVNALVDDVADVKQLVNAVIDDLQAKGILT